MSENLQIWTLVMTTLTSLGLPAIAAIVLYIQYRMRVLEKKVDVVHVATNSMKDALVKATSEAAFAAGEKSERDNPSQSTGPSLLDPSKPASGRPST